MNTLLILKSALKQAQKHPSLITAKFYKTGPGDYAEHDQFIGVAVPDLRKIAKTYSALSLEDIQTLIESPINEERLLALFILVNRYRNGNEQARETIYQFYLNHLQHINNWNLVDASAHLIIGAHLLHANKAILLKLARSKIMWERRIAIVSTWYFIRHHAFEHTLKIADILLYDEHDLIHKAVGWMLREMGKRDQPVLINFLKKNSLKMPRTMLRYAIEKLSNEERRIYLLAKHK